MGLDPHEPGHQEHFKTRRFKGLCCFHFNSVFSSTVDIGYTNGILLLAIERTNIRNFGTIYQWILYSDLNSNRLFHHRSVMSYHFLYFIYINFLCQIFILDYCTITCEKSNKKRKTRKSTKKAQKYENTLFKKNNFCLTFSKTRPKNISPNLHVQFMI